VLAGDLAHPHNGHDPVPFLCLCDSNIEARVMYEAGVRYVIQSESLAVQPPCLTPSRPPCANTRTRTRLEPVAALCVCTRVAYITPLIRYANSRRELMPSFFFCTGARYSAADAQLQIAGKINIHGRLHPSAQSGHGRGAVQRKPKAARAILGA
jgi:hypothetical protein